MLIYNVIFWIVVVILFFILVIIVGQLAQGGSKYFLLKELDLIDRYGKDSWVVISGGSSGQGKEFAINFAKRGFNLLLIGSIRTENTIKEIKQLYPCVQTKFIEVDFGKAFEDDFFDQIEKTINSLNVSILINNVGMRTAWIGYEHMPVKIIKETIATGCMVQSRLIQLVLPGFLNRTNKSAIVNITAQCHHPGIFMDNVISVPYLSIYEAANSFGFYAGNSIYKEYKDRLDILNITPGAVITENTQYLKDTYFNVDCKTFVNNIITMMGQVQGNTCGHWGHSLGGYLVNFAPFIKDRALEQTGKTIAEDYMKNYNKKNYNIKK
jgi:17beta-estradiol 17-dehydrogenase / very-long-chain 3-oxoacyl-CoA reductase